MNTTIAFIHLQVLVRVAARQTIEYDFQQRALEELADLGLVENVRLTRPSANGAPRLRADLTDEGRMARDDCLRSIAQRLER